MLLFWLPLEGSPSNTDCVSWNAPLATRSLTTTGYREDALHCSAVHNQTRLSSLLHTRDRRVMHKPECAKLIRKDTPIESYRTVVQRSCCSARQGTTNSNFWRRKGFGSGSKENANPLHSSILQPLWPFQPGGPPPNLHPTKTSLVGFFSFFLDTRLPDLEAKRIKSQESASKTLPVLLQAELTRREVRPQS